MQNKNEVAFRHFIFLCKIKMKWRFATLFFFVEMKMQIKNEV